MYTENCLICTENDKWSKADVTDVVPEARSAATMATVERKLYLFGGLSQESGWFDGVYMYDIGKDFVDVYFV